MANQTLMQIVNDNRALEALLDESGGELTEAAVETAVNSWVAEIKSNLALKADGYEMRQRTIKAYVEQFKAYSDDFYKAAKQLENLSESLKDRMKFAMVEMGVNEIHGNMFRYKLTPSAPKVVVLDESKIPASFTREKLVVEVDKAAIKKAVLEDERVIEGVGIEIGNTLRTYVNKGK